MATYQNDGALDLGGVLSLDLPHGEMKGYFEVDPKSATQYFPDKSGVAVQC